MGTSGSAPGSRQRAGGAILGVGGHSPRVGMNWVGTRDATWWPCPGTHSGGRTGLSASERGCVCPPQNPPGLTSPFPPRPTPHLDPPSLPSIPVPWLPASRLLRWQSGHIWKPHLAQLQWELKKPCWQQSQSWGAPSPRLQAVTPAGDTALSPSSAPSATLRPSPHVLTLGPAGGSGPCVPVPADSLAEGVPQDPQQVPGQAEGAARAPAASLGAGWQCLTLRLPQRADTIDTELPTVPEGKPAGEGGGRGCSKVR